MLRSDQGENRIASSRNAPEPRLVALPGCSRSTIAAPGENMRRHRLTQACNLPLRNAVRWDRRRLNLRWRDPEHELIRLVPAPDFEPALQSSQQSDRVGSRLFFLKSLEQLACGPPRLGLNHSRSCAVTTTSGSGRRRPRLAFSQTRSAISNLHQPLLAGPDRVQQLDWIQRGVDRRHPLTRVCWLCLRIAGSPALCVLLAPCT